MGNSLVRSTLLLAALVFAGAAGAQVVAVPRTGKGDFGIASQAIANTVSLDTVNGVTATLGANGNGVLTAVGTLPTGIGLNPITGEINTTISTPVGTYTFQYQLCEAGNPTNCAVATDTVTVTNSVVIAVPESGQADFGIASQPILNVAANDSVNGAPAVLGPGGNAVVQAVGPPWQPGIALTPSTGAISTTIAVPVGSYQVQYEVCDLNVPKNCNATTDTITVINSVINPVPDTGTADFGIGSQPVANVAANDMVNGAPAVLGPGGNAVVQAVGTWPPGIVLTPSTGAISTSSSVPAGSYSVSYKLCDLNTPKNCATTTDTVNVITASIQPLPDSGSVAAGVAGTPIANVVANDTVDGQPAKLGPGGNAKITTVGTLPTGFALNGKTGAVTTSASVAPGVYDFSYELCDLNVPANCASAEDEVTVTATVIANRDIGKAIAGLASTAVVNVVGNDTINGQKARLVTSPNASVAQVGAWPAGIALNPSTGAITVAGTVLAGTYNVTYQLCQLGTQNCAMAPDIVTVYPPVTITAVAGSSIVNSSTPTLAIGNVAAHDFVGGSPVTLGSAANAVLAQAGAAWPAGITLNPTTGGVTVAPGTPAGTYPLQYQLCDLNTPPNCATAASNVTVLQPVNEVSVSPYMTGDLEFDWARDGLFCQACNYGIGNSQVNWTDRNNNLWVSNVDPNTGVFTPVSGKGTGVPVDTTAFFWQDWGNGPEWAFSTPPGATNPVSQLVYSRYAPGDAAIWQYTGAGIASLNLVNGTPTWVPAFLPGAYQHLRNDTVLPEASQCPSDPVAYALFTNVAFNTMYTEPVATTVGTAPTLTPFGNYANSIGERFVSCTTWLTFQGDVQIGTNTLQQVFWYDRSTGAQATQLTSDPTTKQRSLMFRAPEYGGQYVLITMAADDQIQVYLQTGTQANGAPSLTLVNTIYSPDPAEPWMFDPKIFIHCTAANPTCATYVAVALAPVVNSEYGETVPNGLAVMNIDPVNPMFNILVPAAKLPATQRFDPKYFITGNNGPVIYYDALLANTATQPYQDLGVYLVNMQLGPPAGPCVGSSAHEGLNPTWPNCTPGVPPGAPAAGYGPPRPHPLRR